MAYRIGLPHYANTAPLVHFLEAPRGVELRFGVPTELNRWLAEGEVDLSLVSSQFYLEARGALRALPDFSVAVLGAVYSVNLFHKRPWEELRRIAITSESATSVRLLGHLLERSGVEAELEPAPVGLEGLATYDGVLLIGDRALAAYAGLLEHTPASVHDLPQRPGGYYVTDLAMRWFRATRLPFVFALWATRSGEQPPPEVVALLRRARREGLGRLGEVAAAESARLGIPAPLLQHYLWNFRYHLEPPDRLGLAAFAEAVGLLGPEEYWSV
ncbi:menaquinone biosynthetic enzyme MqnA/MqnD family protein [Oceanithermus profundus]